VPPIKNCTICCRLRDRETSFSKYLDPDLDRPFPEAADRLVIVAALGMKDAGKRHVRRCPECGTLYDYLSWHEYFINGSEENEELSRMNTAQAAVFIRAQARLLEALRREVDFLESSAGRLGDFIDRGRPGDAEAGEALAAMQEQRRQAAELRCRLQEHVAVLRRSCPEIIAAWAEAHVRVCRSFQASPGTGSENDGTARFVADETLSRWQRLAEGGESFIAIAEPWLDGYLERLDRELAETEKGT